MLPWGPGDGRQRRLQRTSTRDRLLELLHQTKQRRRENNILAAKIVPDREEADSIIPNNSSSQGGLMMPPPEGAYYSSRSRSSSSNHFNNQPNETDGDLDEEDCVMEDDFSRPVSHSSPSLPLAMPATRLASRCVDEDARHDGDSSRQSGGAPIGEVGRTQDEETGGASGNISPQNATAAVDVADGDGVAERSLGLGSRMSGSKSDELTVPRRGAGVNCGGFQAASPSTYSGRRETAETAPLDAAAVSGAASSNDDLEECRQGNDSRQVSSTVEKGCFVACCLEDNNSSSVGLSAARPSPLAILGGSARGSGVLNSGRPVHHHQQQIQQQHILQQQQLYVSPSSVPPSPVTGSGGSGMGFHMTIPVGGGEGGSLPPPVARRSRASCIEDTFGRNGGQFGCGGFKKSYSAAEAVASGGRLSARGMGSGKRFAPPSSGGSISTASNSSPTASAPRSGASTPDLRLPADLPHSLPPETRRCSQSGKPAAASIPASSASATPPRAHGGAAAAGSSSSSNGTMTTKTQALFPPRPGLVPHGGSSNSSSAASTPAARAGRDGGGANANTNTSANANGAKMTSSSSTTMTSSSSMMLSFSRMTPSLSPSASEAATSAAATRRHRLSRSDSVGVWNRRKSKSAHQISPWPARSWSSCSVSLSATPTAGVSGRGLRRRAYSGSGSSPPEDGIRGIGIGIAGALAAGSKRVGSWRGGRRRKEEGGLGGEFFRAEDDVEDGVSGIVGGIGAGAGGGGRVDICRERSYSDSEAVSVTNPCESGRRSSVTRERHGSGGFEDHMIDINGTDSRSGRRPLSKLRSAKLLPSSVAWPAPLSLQRRTGRSRRRTPPPPPPPDDAMVSPPPSCVLYGEDPIEAMGSFPSKGGGVGGGGFDKRMTVRSASFGREGTGHGWATPLFRQRRRGGKRGGFGNGGSGTGGFTSMMPALVPPSPAGLLDAGSSLDVLPAATVTAAAAAASEGKASEKISSSGSRSGFVKLPSKLSLQEVGSGFGGVSNHHHNERQAHEGDQQMKQQQQGVLSSSSHSDRGVGTGITTAASSFSPASSAGGGNEDDPTEDAQAIQGGGGAGLSRSTRLAGSSFTGATVASTAASGTAATTATAAAVTSASSPGDAVAPSPPLLRTPSQAKPSKTEPPRPPGRPPHAQRRQARQKQKRGGLSRITPWDSSDEMQQQAQETDRPQVQVQQQQLMREGRSVSVSTPVRGSRPPKASRGVNGHGFGGSSSNSSSSSNDGAMGLPQEETAIVSGGSGPCRAVDADAGGRASSINKGDGSNRTSSSSNSSGKRRASITPVLMSPPSTSFVSVPRTTLSGAAVDAARGALTATATATTMTTIRKESTAKNVIDQGAAIPDGDAPVRTEGGDGDEDAVSVIGRAVLDHLMSARNHESPETHSIGGRCNNGGFFPPSASKSESGREVDIDDGEFLTARGEKSFFALDGDYSPEQTEEQQQKQMQLQQRLEETEQTSQGMVGPSSIGSDGADVVPDASGRGAEDEGSGFAPPVEGGAIVGEEDFSSPGSVVGDELFAEAVLEEFTVDEGVDDLGCDDDTGGGGDLGDGTRSREAGPPVRKTSWEALIFSRGVFQRAVKADSSSSWTGEGESVPCPPGICLVDQAKELQARRLYELSQAHGKKAAAAAAAAPAAPTIPVTSSSKADSNHGQNKPSLSSSGVAFDRSTGDDHHCEQGPPGQSTAEVPQSAGEREQPATSKMIGSLEGQSSGSKAAPSRTIDAVVAMDRPIWQTTSDVTTQGGKGGGKTGSGDGFGSKPSVSTSRMTPPKVEKPLTMTGGTACAEPATAIEKGASCLSSTAFAQGSFSSSGSRSWKGTTTTTANSAAAMIAAAYRGGDNHASSGGLLFPSSSSPPLPPRPYAAAADNHASSNGLLSPSSSSPPLPPRPSAAAAASATTPPMVVVARMSAAAAVKAAATAAEAEEGQAEVAAAAAEAASGRKVESTKSGARAGGKCSASETAVATTTSTAASGQEVTATPYLLTTKCRRSGSGADRARGGGGATAAAAVTTAATVAATVATVASAATVATTTGVGTSAVPTTAAAMISTSARLAAAAEATAARLTCAGSAGLATSSAVGRSVGGGGRVGAVAVRAPLSGRPRGTVDDPCEVVVADAVRFLVSSSTTNEELEEEEEHDDKDVVAAVAAAAAAATGADPSLAYSRAFRRSSRRLLLRSAVGRGVGVGVGVVGGSQAANSSAASSRGTQQQQQQQQQVTPLAVGGKLSSKTALANEDSSKKQQQEQGEQEQEQFRHVQVPRATASPTPAPAPTPVTARSTTDGVAVPVSASENRDAEQQQKQEAPEPRNSFSSSDGGESFYSALSRVGSSGSVSVSSPAAAAASAAGSGIGSRSGIGIDGVVIGERTDSELDMSIGQIGGSRSSYRPRGVSYGEKPWRPPEATGGSSVVNGGGVYVGGLGDDGRSASSRGEGYRPGNGQGLVVSNGVVLKADVRVPGSTVGVTRGGQLQGRVVAKEFLLEDGGCLEGDVECDYAVIEGYLKGSLVSREVSTIGPSALFDGDVIYNVLELDRGAVITGRLFSIRSTASNALQVVLPKSDAARIKQRRLQHELRQQQQQQQQSVGDRGGVESSVICSRRSDNDAESCSVRARSEGNNGKKPATSSHSQSLSAAMVTTTSLTTASSVMTSSSVMSSVMMPGERRGGFSGEGRDDSGTRAEAVHEGSEEGPKVGSHGFASLSGLWGTMLEGVAWARALSEAPAAAATATAAAAAGPHEHSQIEGAVKTDGQHATRLVRRPAASPASDEDRSRHRSVDHAGERYQVRDIKQIWIRAAERRAQIA